MNFKKNLLVFSILICLFFCISSVSAGDVNDTTVNAYENQVIGDDVITSSQDDLIQKKGSGTFTELQAIIDNASVGSTISLDRDYNYDKEFNSTNGIVINKNLTINGNGHTLNGLSKSRILYIDFRFNENNKVFLKHINFKNGNTSNYGGAILNFADLSIDKCDFRYNYADITAGAVCSLGSLTCKNSNFYKNTANGDAGAIFSFNSNISKSWLKNVSGIHSLDDLRNFIFGVLMGQIKVTPLTDYIKNCKFTGNVALGRGGGAIYALTHISIHSSTFKSNKADEMGGAVYGAKNIIIKNSKFSDNKVSKYGGAVYFKCHDLTSNYENGKWVNHVKFYHCLIENSVFENNVAKKAGGAIYGFKYASNMKKPGAQARKCTFKDNIASLGNEIHGGTAKDCKYKNTLTLKAATIKKSAKKLVLSATVKKDSKPEKGKKVTFTFNGITYTAKTDSKGVAKVTVPSKILKKLKVGKTVEYSAKFYKFTDRKSGKVSK